MGKYTVIVSRRTDAMLLDHVHFLTNVSITAAKRLVEEFEKVLDALEENPFQFPMETDYELPSDTYRKALFCKRYKALFFVADKTVYLDAVLDCRQDNSKYWPI